MMIIRHEREGDAASVASLTSQAFAGASHSDGTEAAIVARLRAAGSLTLSLVAEDGSGLVGHIAFSPVTIDGADCNWFGLGPVSVRPDRQGQGIGSALIRDGLAGLSARGAAGCVVLGDPVLYGRFGFESDPAMRYEGAPPGCFMRLKLDAHASPTGRIDYAPAFTG